MKSSYCPHCKSKVPLLESGFRRAFENQRYTCSKCHEDVIPKSRSWLFGLIFMFLVIGAFCLYSVSASDITATVDTNIGHSVGVIRSDFYGVNTGGAYLANNTDDLVDTNHNGVKDTQSNYTWHQNKIIEGGINLIRIDALLSSYKRNNDGSYNYTSWHSREGKTVTWASLNNKTVSIIFQNMPEYLSNKSNGYCKPDADGENLSCSPNNYTEWNNLILWAIKNITNNGIYNSSVQIEILNEQTDASWLNNLSIDSIQKALEYVKLYNSTYYAVKAIYPNMKVITGSIYIRQPNMRNTILSNLSYIPKLSIGIHDYSTVTGGGTDNYDIFYDNIQGVTTNLLNNCTYFHANCSDVYFSEWNVNEGATQNTSANWNNYVMQIASGYSGALNYANKNVVMGFYKWTESFGYYINSSYYPDYPHLFSMVSEPQIDNIIYPPYNVTKTFANNHKSGNTVLNTSTSRSDLKIVASTDGVKDYITLTNTNSSSITTILNLNLANKYLQDVATGQAYGLSNGNTPSISLSGYEVKTMNTLDGNPLSITNTPSTNLIIQGHTANINTTIDSVNPLDTVQTNLSGVITNIKDPSLILCYNFDNVSAIGENDTKVVDWCGGNNGTIIGGANVSMTSNGKYKGAVNFSGNIKSTVNVSNLVGVNFNYSNFTMSLWFNRIQATSQTLLSYESGANDKSWSLVINPSGTIEFQYYNKTGSQNVVDSTAKISTGWNNLVLVISNTTLNGLINNVALFTNTNLPKGGLSQLGNPNMHISGNRGNTNFFNGTVDEVLFWNRSLTLSEMSIIYNNSLSKFNSTRYILNSLVNVVGLSSSYGVLVNDSSNNIVSSLQNINRNQNISLLNNILGIVRPDFYSLDIDTSRWLNGYKIDTNNDGVLDTASNATWNKEALLVTGIKMYRGGIPLNGFYSNQTTRTNGVNFTGDVTNYTAALKFAYENNKTYLGVIMFMPIWLADNSTGKCIELDYCPPYNFTIFNNIVNDSIWRITNNGQYLSALMIEFGNEPYSDFYMGGYTFDNVTRALNYVNFYNKTYDGIKSFYPNIKFGVTVGADYTPNTIATVISNLTNSSGYSKWDFITIHGYGNDEPPNWLVKSNPHQSVLSLLGNCTLYNANCNNIYVTEFALKDSATANSSNGQSSIYSANIAVAYSTDLNYAPSIVSLTWYNWGYEYSYFHNPSNFQEYPDFYSMISQAGLDNPTPTYYPPYTITSNFTRYAPALSTIYNSSSNYAPIVQVYDKIGNTYNLIITNTENDQQNVSSILPKEVYIIVTGDNQGAIIDSDGVTSQSGILSNYSVTILTTAYPIYRNGVWEWDNYLNESQRAMSQGEINLYTTSQQQIVDAPTSNLCGDLANGIGGLGWVFWTVIVVLGLVLVTGAIVVLVQSVKQEEIMGFDTATIVGVTIIGLFVLLVVGFGAMLALKAICSA